MQLFKRIPLTTPLAPHVKVLFVCMGNLCRSPLSQGVLEKLVSDAGLSDMIYVDSAGTHTYYIDYPPDKRAQTAAKKRGYNLSHQRARTAVELDFETFDYVVAMDYDNIDYLNSICPPGKEGKLNLFMEFASNRSLKEIPDPYYGGLSGFERVLDFAEDAGRGLLKEIRMRYRL